MERKPKTKSGGRPSLVDAEQMAERIVDTAKELFFTQGFDRTSVEQIAATAHIAKRTIYSRFPSKAEIFEAVVKSHIDRHFTLFGDLDVDGLKLRDKLGKIAEALLDHYLLTDALDIDRAIASEGIHFPGLAEVYESHAAPRFIGYVADLLRRDAERHAGDTAQAEEDATVFLILVVLPILRQSMFRRYGPADREAEFDRVNRRIDFFMRGLRPD